MPLTETLRARTDYLNGQPELIRRGDDRIYSEILFRHLGARGAREVEFFVNRRRFYLFADLIGPHLKRSGLRVLNAACGPFALEYYCPLDGAEIVSFDRDAELIGVYRDLAEAGLIRNAHFFVGTATAPAVSRRFDLVVINDLFYSDRIDFFAAIDRYVDLVEPGGYLYFDILDRRARRIWAMAGKDRGFRRYDLDGVARHLEARGLTIVTAAPSMGIKGGLDEKARRFLWSSMGIANNIAIVARGG